jgi:hypothetical protein
MHTKFDIYVFIENTVNIWTPTNTSVKLIQMLMWCSSKEEN